MGKWKRDRFVSSETPFKKWIFQNLETYSHEFVYITTGFFCTHYQLQKIQAMLNIPKIFRRSVWPDSSFSTFQRSLEATFKAEFLSETQ